MQKYILYISVINFKNMTKSEALQNAIAEMNNNVKPIERQKITHTWLSKEEKDKRHFETMVRLVTLMAESNKAKIESVEACI